jgi:DNA-binding NarL/FixJ family response regulator
MICVSIRIGLVDKEIVRQGISALLNKRDDIKVVGQGNCMEDAFHICNVCSPDILITDFIEPETLSLSLLAKLHEMFPKTKLFVLTTQDKSHLIQDSLQAGVLGYWFKNASLDQLINAIHTIHLEQVSLAPEARHALLTILSAPHELGYDLTSREWEVLSLMSKGHNNSKIAYALCISPFTVKNHVSKILSKLGVANRVEAATLVLENKLLLPYMDNK